MDTTITFVGLDEVIDTLTELPSVINAALNNSAQMLANELQQNVRDDKLSGQVLNDKSGALKNSINEQVDETGTGVEANVFVDGDIPYAAILEYGGETKAHIIRAVNAKALAFNWNGKQAIYNYVNHPGSDIAPHPYLESALSDMQDEIPANLSQAVDNVLP